MNIEELREYCLKKKGVDESFPFDETVLVFKVMGKIFALTSTEGEFTINLKCEPEKAIELREKYSGVKPGYHMNKKHWNTIYFDGSVSDLDTKEWVDQSYHLVVKSLTKAQQQHLKNLYNGKTIITLLLSGLTLCCAYCSYHLCGNFSIPFF